MIVLKYRRIDPTVLPIGEFFMLEEIIDGSPDIVKFELRAEASSELIIGEKRYRIRSGSCMIPFGDIPCNVVDVQVRRGGKDHFATPFLKIENTILRLPIDEGTFEQLKAAYLELEGKICAIESRVSEIETEIRPHNLFDFN